METSKIIEEFLNLCNNAERQFEFNKEIVDNCNKKTNDYSHRLELENDTYNDRVKLQTQQRKNLKERRESKNIIEILEPIIEYKNGNKNSLNMLRQTLGKIRKVENYHENRTYRKRAE